MSAPFAADTLSPTRDRACWEIATFLRDRLNADYQAIACNLEDPVMGDRPVVVGIADYNAWSNNFADFPYLCCYRQSSSGLYLDTCSAAIAYYLPSMAVQDEVPGILRWVETRIARALAPRGDFYEGSQDLVFAHIVGNIRSEYGIGVLPGSEVSAFPFIRVLFDFQEIGV